MKFILAFFLIFVSVLIAQPEIPKLTMWATDLTNTLSQSELSELNFRLKTYADTSSNQVIVLMISSLDGYPIEMLAQETATKNKIGTKKFDNGILLLVVKNDRKVRLEVGYGLEGTVPDAVASSIIRNVIIPKFRNDNYYLGISDGINSIILAIGGEYKAQDSEDENDFPFVVFVIIIVVIFLFIKRGGPFVPGGVYRNGTNYSGTWSSGSSGWGSGGSFSGGGGSFGGGGASGSW